MQYFRMEKGNQTISNTFCGWFHINISLKHFLFCFCYPLSDHKCDTEPQNQSYVAQECIAVRRANMISFNS